MKRISFFRKIFIIMTFLILIDRGLGTILQHYYLKIRHGEQGRTNYVIDSCNSETIILGSSRAAHHYVSPVISEILHTTCYNAGKDKQRLRYCLAMLNILYQRYSPKQILLDLNPTAFEVNENGLDELSVLLPYYGLHPEIRSIVNERNRFECIKTYSDLYRLNSLPLKILFNNISKERDANESSGYVPLVIHKELIPDTPDKLPGSLPIDSSIVNCFKDIVRLVKDHGSRLFVIVSPIYYQLPENLKTIEIAKSICRNEKIIFLDYSQSRLFLDHGPEMFLDMGHLNDSSAIVFSTILSRDLRNIH
ncbi:MAG TPA: hypothetical protein VGZ90_10115 [Puia sp.]|jgi:hypothetical protein|nr:hypothetical protein [Puia sp.]